jgi:hypothetical protein
VSKWLERSRALDRFLPSVPKLPKSPKQLLPRASIGSFGTIGNFGTGSRYPKQLQQEPEIDLVEGETVAVEMGRVPKAYARAFAAIQANRPAEVPYERWNQFINDAGVFLDHWGMVAADVGWTAHELFGLHPTVPMARYDRMGLIWMLKDERVIALTDKSARVSDGLTFYRRRKP